MIENVPSFTSLRVSDALKDLVLEIARTFSLALLWRQVMLAGTGNELIADEDRSPGRIGELHCVDAEILRLCVRDWVRAALQKRLGVGMRRQEPFDRIGMRRVGLGRTQSSKEHRKLVECRSDEIAMLVGLDVEIVSINALDLNA